jgi:hypothetical protein
MCCLHCQCVSQHIFFGEFYTLLLHDLSIHCTLLCGAMFDEWYSEIIKIGLNSSILPSYRQSKLSEYNGNPPSGQVICAYCIESLKAKIGMKLPSMRTVSHSNLDDSTVKFSTTICQSVAVHLGTQTNCSAGDKCRMGSINLSSDPKHWCLVCNLFMLHHIHMCGMFYSR